MSYGAHSNPNALGARADGGFFGGGDPGDVEEGPPGGEPDCEAWGDDHEWCDAGGGMQICRHCERQRWVS